MSEDQPGGVTRRQSGLLLQTGKHHVGKGGGTGHKATQGADHRSRQGPDGRQMRDRQVRQLGGHGRQATGVHLRIDGGVKFSNL